MSSKTDALRRTELFGSAPAASLEELAAACQTRELKSGDLLFLAGDPSAGLFVVVEGCVRAFRHGLDGREQVIHEDGPGSTFPEVAVFDDGPCPSSVAATNDTVLLFIPKERVRRFCLSHPEVALAALGILSRRLRRTTSLVENLALREVAQRVADYLVKQMSHVLATGPRKPLALELPHTNQEIAERVGTVREVVSRAFAEFRRRGWVRKTQRRVTILDPAALESYAKGE